MGRYSDISRGPELAQAYEKLEAWRKKSKAQKRAAYKEIAKPASDRVKVERVEGYILPFNSDNDKVYLTTRIISGNQTGIGSGTANLVRGLINDRAIAALPEGAAANGLQAFSGRKYKFARIIASERTQTATQDSASRKTDNPYKRHRSNNVSSPFGRDKATDNYTDAVKAIKAKTAYKDFVKLIGSTIGFDPEG